VLTKPARELTNGKEQGIE